MSLKSIVKKSIDVPLMDIYNMSNMILEYVKTTFFVFEFEWALLNSVPHYIKALILASTKEEAWEMLKEKLDLLNDHDFGREINFFKNLTIDHFEIKHLDNVYRHKLPRIETITIDQGYHGMDLEYKFYDYKCRCKPLKKWFKQYDCRRDYYSSLLHSSYVDSDIDSLPYIKNLF